jgi:PAS domain S-box-containing protein
MVPTHSLRVLVVEDDAAIHELIKTLVIQSGHNVAGSAYNGREAVELTCQLKPDVVLMDIVMPDPDTGHEDKQAGMQAAQKILNCCSKPVILLTAHESPELLDQASHLGVGAYLVKPPRQSDLVRAISIACARHADLMECRRLYLALQESEQRYHTLFQHSQEAILLTRPDGGILAANPAACQMFGRTEEDLRRLGRQGVVDPSDNRLAAALAAREAQGYARCELTFLRGDGTHFQGEVSSSVFQDSRGVPKTSMLIRDISERKRIEETLLFLAHCGCANPNEDFFQSLAKYLAQCLGADYVCIDRLQDGVLSAQTLAVCSDGRFEDNVTYTLKDTPCGDVVGKTICCFEKDVTTLFPRDLVLQEMKAESYVGTTLWSHTDKPIGLIALIWRRPLEKTEQIKSILQLVAVRAAGELERQNVAEELRKSEALLNATGKMARIGGWELELATQKLTWTQEVYRIHEVDVNYQPSVKTAIGFYTAESKPIITKSLQQAIDSGASFDLDLQVTTARNNHLWVRAMGQAHQWDGKVYKVSGTFQDITERKNLEERLRQSQKMEGIGHLAGGVAHEFNNILAALMMNMSILQESVTDVEPQESFQQIKSLSTRAAELVRQLLAFSRQTVMQAKPMDLNPLVSHFIHMLRQVVGETIILEFSPTPNLPLVQADLAMIEQVLLNLCLNARDAMPEGGRMGIALAPVSVSAESTSRHPDARPGQFVCLSVSDTGRGMNEAVMKSLFEPFFTTKDVGKGTGLGLATVHGIVHQHHGWVEVESAVGRGSIFRVFLPMAQEECASVLPKPAPVPRRLGNETILLVEDEVSLRKVLGTYLRRQGYQVLEADTGQAALKLWQNYHSQIALLFTDQVMPEGMTGLQLAERLRQDNAGLKVIISSGYGVDEFQVGKWNDQGIVYLPKPYDVTLLSKTLHEGLDKR